MTQKWIFVALVGPKHLHETMIDWNEVVRFNESETQTNRTDVHFKNGSMITINGRFSYINECLKLPDDTFAYEASGHENLDHG